MHRTIGIAVGCAAIYILLVIGLMIYCRARRARLLKGIFLLKDKNAYNYIYNYCELMLSLIRMSGS